MRGTILPSRTATVPSKVLPMMLSWRQISPRAQFAVLEQAGEFGTGAGAARGAVVGLAGTEDEVAAIRRRVMRGTEQLDVVYLLPGGRR